MMKRLSLVAAAVGIVAIAMTAGVTLATAGHESSSATSVKTLHAFKSRSHLRYSVTLPASVSEVVANMTGHFQANATGLRQLTTGSPSVFVFRIGSGQLCVVVALTGAGGFCNSALGEAGGALATNVAIVDGKMFVIGLAANNVSSISASFRGNATALPVKTQVVDNAFVASLPYQGGGVGSISVNATRTDGSTGAVTIPATPAPTHG